MRRRLPKATGRCKVFSIAGRLPRSAKSLGTQTSSGWGATQARSRERRPVSCVNVVMTETCRKLWTGDSSRSGCGRLEARELWTSWSFGGSAAEMSDPGEEIRARTAVDGRGPADDVRAAAEQREDLTVPVGTGLEAAVDAPSMGRARFQRGRGCGDAVGMFPMPPGGLLACRLGARSPVHRSVSREASQVGATGFRQCRPPRGRGRRWRDPAGRGFPRVEETPPRRRPACRRSNGSARLARLTGWRIATNPPAERESGDRRDERRSRRRR